MVGISPHLTDLMSVGTAVIQATIFKGAIKITIKKEVPQQR
jgi:hypothetical protein